ncbi:glycerate kinase type-2 family protein [Maribacter cobaltidurans]|uniref:Uncharacterized protein n=1 Tax=Maribacter cobaltidurans TaxID=1178778 RepID=A0A223V6L2_9FLAO|nr:glycerate kinase [Maribacter cobaltidurans]ASV31041.1 hypothetical protein CJ263_12930 [Maribacter cobaltidurans]GGD96274.1 hydroxypyruvate reductase [Maribacter cobaltidurans]
MNSRKIALEIFLSGVESVRPKELIIHNVLIENKELKIGNNIFELKNIKNIYVVGAGKASASMAQALEDILENRITQGHIVTKYGHSLPLEVIEVTEAAHPIPDENGVQGTKKILSILNKTTKDDLVICLISGGGSALLADVPDRCLLDDLKSLNILLLKIGADISEINCIRKHISQLKGGQLSKKAFPSRVVSLILSDVIGDPLESIASGPTACDPTTFSDAISIINKYKIKNKMPKQLFKLLEEGVDGHRQETVKEYDGILTLTSNFIIGTNQIALQAAKKKAESFGYKSLVVTDRINGDVVDVSNYILEKVKKVRKINDHGKTCLLFGGEPTVSVKGKGLGGRNQHLALIIASSLRLLDRCTILVGGTDGSDGPTDAAGAIVDSFTIKQALMLGLSEEEYIGEYNSYHFFKQVGGQIKIGPTQTNVMDLIVVLIK